MRNYDVQAEELLCLTPPSTIREYCITKPFSSLTLHGMLKQIMRVLTACCGAAHNVDVQQSARRT